MTELEKESMSRHKEWKKRELVGKSRIPLCFIGTCRAEGLDIRLD
jgi:hypothetical protein